jgi:hypothetical protein
MRELKATRARDVVIEKKKSILTNVVIFSSSSCVHNVRELLCIEKETFLPPYHAMNEESEMIFECGKNPFDNIAHTQAFFQGYIHKHRMDG